MQNIQKIGLIELAHHNEVLRSYLVLFLERQHTEIYVFTSQWNYEQCYDLKANNRINWYIKKNETTQAFLNKFSASIDEMDIIIQTTYEDAKGELCLPKTSSTLALVIHDLHTNFMAWNSIKINKEFPEILKEVGRLIKFFLLKKRKLESGLNAADYLILPSLHVLKYAKANIPNHERFLHLPFTINDEISTIQENEEIQVTIPGTISDKSRDYLSVFKALEGLSQNTRFKLTLLGKPIGSYGNKIIGLFSELKNINLKYYTAFIPQSEFDQVMRKSDFLILPMKEIMKFGVVGEKNGYSCVSGNMNDFIRYGIPAMLPKFYPLTNQLKEVSLQYSSSIELKEGIEKWIGAKTYNSLKGNKMKNALEIFSKENVISLFDENFNSVLK